MRTFLLAALLAAALPLPAAVLWDNGTATSDSLICFSTPNGCSISGHSRIYDDFQLLLPATVTGFTFNAYGHKRLDLDAVYDYTSWSIWSGDPYSGGVAMASGTAMAVLSAGAADSGLFTVSGLNLALAPGTYWLGLQNVMMSGATTFAWSTGNGLPTYKSTDDVTQFYTFNGDAAFTILGESSAVPEPRSVALFSAACLLALCRRCTK